MLLLRLAWRNLFRNSRRTALTAAAGVFAVALSMTSLSLALGSHERWIEHVVRLYSGHIELTTAGYRAHRTLDHGMTLSDADRRALDELTEIDGWAPRLESWALVLPDRDGALGRAAWVLGIDPSRESVLSRIGMALERAGLEAGAEHVGVVLGRDLADNLGVDRGDTVVLLTSDYYGSQSADRFFVSGTIAVGDPTIDAYLALLHIRDLREFVEYPAGVSHVAVFASDTQEVESVRSVLASAFPPPQFDVLSWHELIPDLVQMLVLDDVGNYLTLSVLIVVVTFGLLNTILMSVFERVREFGVMRAIGVRPRRIFALVMIEALMVSAIGLAVGFAISIPGLLWMEQHPIPMTAEALVGLFELFGIEPALAFRLSGLQVSTLAGVLLGAAVLAALPPAWRAARGRPADALSDA